MLIPTLGKGMTSPGFVVSAAHAAYSQMPAAAKPLYVRVLHHSTRDQLKGLLAAQDASGPTAATVLGRRPRREATVDESSSAELADLKAKVAVAKALAQTEVDAAELEEVRLVKKQKLKKLEFFS